LDTKHSLKRNSHISNRSKPKNDFAIFVSLLTTQFSIAFKPLAYLKNLTTGMFEKGL